MQSSMVLCDSVYVVSGGKGFNVFSIDYCLNGKVSQTLIGLIGQLGSLINSAMFFCNVYFSLSRMSC